jgi:hypothetical protein
MMGRLIGAQLRRVRWIFLSVAMFGVLSVTQSSSLGGRMNMALSLIMAVNVLTTLGIFWSREVRVLPIAPETALRSAWCVGMLFPLVLLLGRLLVAATYGIAGWPPRFAAEAIGITFVFDAVYVGASLLVSQQRDVEWRGLSGLAIPVALLRLLAFLAWIALPFAWPEIVPKALGDITPWHIAALLAGVAAALWPVVFPDGKWPSFNVIHDARRPATASHPPPRDTDRWLDRLHGLNRLLPGLMAGAAVIAVVSLGLYVGLSRLRGPVRSLFDAGMTDLEFLLVGGVGLLLLAPLSAGSGLTPFLRRLRVMPIGSRRLCLTLTLLPLMTPVFFWMFAGVAHAVIWNDAPAAWRPGALLFFCGILALSASLITRFNSPVASLLAGIMPLTSIMALMMFLDRNQIEPVLAVLLPAVGLIGLSAAFLVNHHTVTRASSYSPAYRQPAVHTAR